MTVAESEGLNSSVVKSVESPPGPTENSATELEPKAAESVLVPSQAECRTVDLPMNLLRRIEKLRRATGAPSGNGFLTRLIILGLAEFENQEQVKGYREGKILQ